jgi:dihydroneopterin aldolase
VEAADQIHIQELEIFARVGVPEEERATPQRLSLNITVWPSEPFDNLHDDIGMATDYATVCAVVRDFAATRADRLIETLAGQIAEQLLKRFAIRKVHLELRKFVLKDAKYAAVIITRTAAEG